MATPARRVVVTIGGGSAAAHLPWLTVVSPADVLRQRKAEVLVREQCAFP